ncbi:MAG: sensor domain-containing diguanylate cyclase [Anaerolineae bacterium]|nr:sensor domain-containing diguanylate cyclase [Anaerolineae bacterium]
MENSTTTKQKIARLTVMQAGMWTLLVGGVIIGHQVIMGGEHGSASVNYLAGILWLLGLVGMLLTTGSVVARVEGREVIETEVLQKSADLQLINDLNYASNHGASMQDLLNILTRRTEKSFKGFGATVYLLSQDAQYLRMHTRINLSEFKQRQLEKLLGVNLPTEIRIPLSNGSMYRKILDHGEAQLITDPQNIQAMMGEFTDNKLMQKFLPRIFDILKIKSVMTMPLISQDEIIGVLDISSRRLYTHSDLHRMETIANHVTATLKQKRAEENLQYLATHDRLTGLPNRTFFQEYFTRAIGLASRRQQILALLFVDLDGFKEINDEYGHLVGDEVLKVVAQRLRACMRQSDMIARLGGDEFLLSLEALPTKEAALPVCKKILTSIRKEITIEGQTMKVSASVGVSLFPEDGKEYEVLLRHADAAMYKAKKAGKNRCEFYTSKR